MATPRFPRVPPAISEPLPTPWERSRLRRVRSLLVVAVAVILAGGRGMASPCHASVTVEATGYGVVGERRPQQHNLAVLEALAAAVTQVRGAFVEVESTLVDSFVRSMSGADLSVRDESAFTRIVQARASGMVVAYGVIRTSEEAGVLAVTVRATVCTDPRLILDWRGSTVPRTAFHGSLVQALESAGWHLIVADARFARHDLVGESLRTGATHVATVSVAARDAGEYRGLRTFDVSFDLSVHDVRGRELLAGLHRTINVVGRTVDEATSSAARDAATDLANELVRVLRTTRAPDKRLTIEGARRPNTGVELLRLIADVPGVAHARLSGPGDTETVLIDTARSMCDVAHALTENRRMLTRVERCDDDSATVRVVRE